MRRLFYILLIALGALLGYAIFKDRSILESIRNFGTRKNAKEEARDLQKAKDLLYQGKPEEALGIIHEYAGEIERNSSTSRLWAELLIRANVDTLNKPQLAIIWEHTPQPFHENEKGSLLVADYFISSDKKNDFDKLRKAWRGREETPEAWFVLDADRMLLEGKRREAVEFLSSHSFKGKADTDRLIRLALMNVIEDPKKSWEYLTLAYTKDPENPDIRTFRAKLLETVGKNSLALSEYLAAIHIDPDNLLLKDQLAEFYLRHKQYQQALQVWTENLNPPSLDFIWVKAIFWSKTVTPVNFDWEDAIRPEGKLAPLVNYFVDLPEEKFWDQELFNKIPNGVQFLKTQQATLWLRLLQNLKDGKEQEAYALLLHNPFGPVSWDPALEIALRRVLNYRLNGTLEAPEKLNPLDLSGGANTKQNETTSALHPFYRQLEELAQETNEEDGAPKISENMQDLLMSQEAYAVLFLASGWNEAAIELHKMEVLPEYFPEWIAQEYTQALRQNFGINPALEFAHLQKHTPELQLLIGELYIASNQPEEALKELGPIAEQNTEIGSKAAWMIGLLYMEKGQYELAKKTILSQPKLRNELLGRETLARIALLEGNVQQADSLYSSIVAESSEAKSYLARKAFQEKNWKRARELTEDLLRAYPNNALLKENLQKIIDQQRTE